ncbi:MAG: hypothetical protein P1U56_22105 [Saprospiraceae bacterium]|nr:hypothetical protein [Saprospiraceae bacterium]
MNQIKVHILLVAASLTLLSCDKKREIDISGAWVYKTVNRDSLVEPLETFYPTSYPSFNSFHDIVYIDKDKIDHPLMRPKNDFSIQGKFTQYEIENNKIVLLRDSLKYTYDIQINENTMCIDDRFCLERSLTNENRMDSTIFKFAVKQEFGLNYEFWMNHYYMSNESICEIRYETMVNYNSIDTIKLSEETKSYILSMLYRIPEYQLDKIYNNGLSHCTEISIDFYDSNGWKGIETCGLTHNNPFEVRALATNMFWILIKHLRKEE